LQVPAILAFSFLSIRISLTPTFRNSSFSWNVLYETSRLRFCFAFSRPPASPLNLPSPCFFSLDEIFRLIRAFSAQDIEAKALAPVIKLGIWSLALPQLLAKLFFFFFFFLVQSKTRQHILGIFKISLIVRSCAGEFSRSCSFKSPPLLSQVTSRKISKSSTPQDLSLLVRGLSRYPKFKRRAPPPQTLHQRGCSPPPVPQRSFHLGESCLRGSPPVPPPPPTRWIGDRPFFTIFRSVPRCREFSVSRFLKTFPRHSCGVLQTPQEAPRSPSHDKNLWRLKNSRTATLHALLLSPPSPRSSRVEITLPSRLAHVPLYRKRLFRAKLSSNPSPSPRVDPHQAPEPRRSESTPSKTGRKNTPGSSALVRRSLPPAFPSGVGARAVGGFSPSMGTK